MKRLLIAAVALAFVPRVVSAQMMGGMMGGGDMPSTTMQEAKAPAQPSGTGGMMSHGMMSGMMGQGQGMMSGCMMAGGMMGSETMGSMSPMMGGMMPDMARGSMTMADGMMRGHVDLSLVRRALGLSDEQADQLRAALRPLQKEAILASASQKVAEMELADLLVGEKGDFGKVEAKLKEIEGIRTRHRLAHLKAAEAVKGILSRQQMEKFQEIGECRPSAPAPAPKKEAAPQGESGHEGHH